MSVQSSLVGLAIFCTLLSGLCFSLLKSSSLLDIDAGNGRQAFAIVSKRFPHDLTAYLSLGFRRIRHMLSVDA